MLKVELLKLKRSSVWVVAVILPVLAAATGSINFWMNKDGMLQTGWDSLFSQVYLFYSFIFLSMGVALLAACAWRAEHQGTNWNLLRTHSRGSLSLLTAKTVAILIPVFFMQVILFFTACIAGLFILGEFGLPPMKYVIITGISTLATLPLIALQSLLSAKIKSFAVPIGVCFFGCVVGIGAMMAPGPLGYLRHVVPQALVTRALSLGSTAVSDSPDLSFAAMLPLLISVVALTGIILMASTKVVKMYSA